MTTEEAKEISASRKVDFDSTRLARIYELSGGWAAGLVLLLAQAGVDPQAGHDSSSTSQTIFDYFAVELFERLASGKRARFSP